MSWIAVALAGYFFNAVATIFDKFLLSGRIQAPAVYAFYVSLFSLFAFGFAPFGLHFFGWYPTLLALVSGVVFLYGLVALYIAVQRHEISRVAPLVGLVTSLVTACAAFIFGNLDIVAVAGLSAVLALLLLIGGGILISFDFPLRKGEYIPIGPIIGAGASFGISLLLLKQGYSGSNFVSGLIWSRLGMVVGGLSLFLVPLYRHQILGHSDGISVRSERAVSTGLYFVVSKVFAGTGSFLVVYAISIGSVSFVQALSGMQYLFLLFLTLPLAFRFPHIYGERRLFWDWLQKIVAIGLIALGLWVATAGGIVFIM